MFNSTLSWISMQLLFITAVLTARCQPVSLERINQTRNQLSEARFDSARARLLLDLALSYVYLPGENPKDLDSAVLLIHEAEKINAHLRDKKIEAKAYFAYSNALREGGKTEAGKVYIQKSIEVYKTMSAPAELADAWIEQSRYYSTYYPEHEVREKRECLAQALPLYVAAGNKERQADVLKDLGDIDHIQGNAVLAMRELNEALNIYISIGHKEVQGIYDLMGYICGKKGDLTDAVKYGLLAVKTAEEVKDTSIQLCTIYNRLGVAYGYWSKYDEALIYSKKALSIAIKYKDHWAILATLESRCRLLATLRKEKEALESIQLAAPAIVKPWNYHDSGVFNLCYVMTYVEEQKYDMAKESVGQVEHMLKTVPKDVVPYTWYQYVVKYYLGIEQYVHAERLMSDYLALIPKNENRSLARAYKLNAQLDSAKGDFKSALSNYQLYKSTSDSILNEATTLQFAQLQVEHETEKKDNDIKILKQQETIQEANLNRSRLVNNIVIGGVILLALLLSVLYNRYRTKQRLNRELRVKQEEINEKNVELENLVSVKDELILEKDELIVQKEWLVKEIHHRVKNNLQMIISLLNTQSEFLKHPSALRAIQESRERMQAIAIIHQRLYQAEGSTKISMRSYISELVEHIENSFADSGRIFFHLDIENVNLDISQSVPLGLILNEAITNAMKYAYPKNEEGIIDISLGYIRPGGLQLKIMDHGKGLPESINVDHSNTLGMQLMKLFAEQLDGELSFVESNGLQVVLEFESMEYNKPSPVPEREITLSSYERYDSHS